MIHKNFKSFLIILILAISSCVSSPPEKPDNICEIFKEKRGWYKAALESEKMETCSKYFDGFYLSRIKLSG